MTLSVRLDLAASSRIKSSAPGLNSSARFRQLALASRQLAEAQLALRVPAAQTLHRGDTRGHVATEHDACAWETWLSLGFPLRVPTGTLEHRLKCQRLLTSKTTKNMPKYTLLHLPNSCRSGGPHKNGLARFCIRTLYGMIRSYSANQLVARPANTGLQLHSWSTYAYQNLQSLDIKEINKINKIFNCLLYTSPSPRDLSTSRMPSSA